MRADLRVTRAFLLGGLIGLAILAATAMIPREHVPQRTRSFKHHQLQHGRVKPNLPPGTWCRPFSPAERAGRCPSPCGSRAEPRLVAADDHVVDFDLRIVSGGLVVGSTHAIAADFIAIPVGAYRARIAGEGYRVARGAARLRIDLWPRRDQQPPRVRRRWPGWTR